MYIKQTTKTLVMKIFWIVFILLSIKLTLRISQNSLIVEINVLDFCYDEFQLYM